MPAARHLRRVAPLLALLVALIGIAATSRQLAEAPGDRGTGQVAQGSEVVAEAAAVLRSTGSGHRSHATPGGPPLAWLAVAALTAAALVVAAVARVPVAVPSGITAHVRRRGPPSAV